MEKTGKWNRIEGEIRDQKITLFLNGSEIGGLPVPDSRKGPLAFSSHGKLEMSNFYVRPLAKKTADDQ